MSRVYADALQAISQQAAAYQVNEDTVTEYRRRMRTTGPGYAAGGLAAILVETAAQHRADCAATGCGTCDGLRRALGLALANARDMVDLELADITRLQRAPWWRRILGDR